MKKIIIIIAIAASPISARAQQWPALPGSSFTQQLLPYCYDPRLSGFPYTPGNCSAAALAANGSNLNSTLGSPQNQVSSVPTNAALSGSGVSILVYGTFADPTSASGQTIFSGYVPLSAFAMSGSNISSTQLTTISGQYDSLNSRISTFIAKEESYNAEMLSSQNHIERGLAMTSAIFLASPAYGSNNRIAVGLGDYRGIKAISLNYSRRAGHYDFALAASFTGSDSLGKAGFGVSW